LLVGDFGLKRSLFEIYFFCSVPISDRFVEIREKVKFAHDTFETAIVKYMPDQRYGLSLSRRKMYVIFFFKKWF
jgi:hypothetical protein